MSKRHGRNTRRRQREMEYVIDKQEHSIGILRSRLNNIERERPKVVACKVMDSVYRPGKNNFDVKFIEMVVTPPRIALRRQVDVTVDFDHFDEIAERIKSDIISEMDSQLRSCFTELIEKAKGESK